MAAAVPSTELATDPSPPIIARCTARCAERPGRKPKLASEKVRLARPASWAILRGAGAVRVLPLADDAKPSLEACWHHLTVAMAMRVSIARAASARSWLRALMPSV